MKAVSIMGHIDNQENILKQIIKSSHMHVQSVEEKLDSSEIEGLLKENNFQISTGISLTNSNSNDKYIQIKNDIKKINEVYDNLEITEELQKAVKDKNFIYDYNQIEQNAKEIFNQLESVYSSLKVYLDRTESLQKLLNDLKYIKNLDIDIDYLKNLENFDFKCLKTFKENSIKLFDNYENIPLLIFKVHEAIEYDVLVSFIPKIFKTKSEEVFNSINFEEVNILDIPFSGKPREIINSIEKELDNIQEKIHELEKEREVILYDNFHKIVTLNRSLDLENIISHVKNHMLFTKNLFFIRGYVPEDQIEDFKKYLDKYSELVVIIEKEPEGIEDLPPVKLKNSPIIKPFEMMVDLYGTPNYHETDPTWFLGLTYMLFFGAMFGDLGQGFVLFLIGWILTAMKKFPQPAGILKRIGLSSMFFGIMYGSIFGLEDVIEPLFMSPMHHIIETLLIAVGIGVPLLIMSNLINVKNCLKEKNIEEGIFGEKGIVRNTYICRYFGSGIS